MPQPVFSGTPITCTFGGKALPVVGTTLSNINLNDGHNWWLQTTPDFSAGNRSLGSSPLLFRAKGTYLSDDFGPRMISLPMFFYEGTEFGGSSMPLGQAISQLQQAGEQNLSFDAATAIAVKLAAVSNRRPVRSLSPFGWTFNLEFLAVTPWFSDLAATIVGPTALAGSVSPGTGTNINYTYLGSVFAEPVFTLTIPVGNTVTITAFTLKNNTSGESLSLTFNPALLAATAYTITIDCANWTVKDANGINYDLVGSFPMLYPPAGTVNAYTATLTTGSGTSTGVTLGISYKSRWEI